MCIINAPWAQTYLQISVTILIFGISIPSLILQTIVQDDVRRIVYRHFGWLKWTNIFIWIVFPIALSLIWFSSGCGTSQPNTASGSSGNLVPSLNDAILTGVFITISLCALVWGSFLQGLFRKEKIMEQLSKECKNNFELKGVVNNDSLEEIRYFGEHGETGKDRLQALKILGSLALDIQLNRFYKGNELEGIIEAIEFILLKESDIHNFSHGIIILKQISENFKRITSQSSADIAAILRSLQRLADIPFSIDNGILSHKIIDTIEIIRKCEQGNVNEAALSLLYLGTAAIKHGNIIVAVEALRKLEAFNTSELPLGANKSAAFLGLLAHFWSNGDSGKQLAYSTLIKHKFLPTLQKCLLSVIATHYNNARFETADKLRIMIIDLEKHPLEDIL